MCLQNMKNIKLPNGWIDEWQDLGPTHPDLTNLGNPGKLHKEPTA